MVSVIFKPSDSYYSFGRLADPEDIARHGPLSQSPNVRHAKRSYVRVGRNGLHQQARRTVLGVMHQVDGGGAVSVAPRTGEQYYFSIRQHLAGCQVHASPHAEEATASLALLQHSQHFDTA